MLYDLAIEYPNAGPAILTVLLMILVIALFWCIQSRWEREDSIEFWRKYRDDEARRLYKTRCIYPPESDDDRYERIEREHFGDPVKKTGIYTPKENGNA